MENDPYKDLAKSLFAASASPASKEHLSTLVNSLSAWPQEGYSAAIVYPPQYPTYMPQVTPSPSPSPSASPSPSPSPEIPASGTNLQSAYFQLLLHTTSKDLGEIRFDLRQRSNRAFYVALSLGIVGGICIVIGFGFIFAKILPVGIAGSIGGVLSGYFSNVFYKIYKTENGNVTNVMKDLRRIEETRIGLWLADNITDKDKRDEAIKSLIDKASAG